MDFEEGLKVNTGKTKVMVGRIGGKMIVNSGKGMQATLFTVQYVKIGFTRGAWRVVAGS